MRFTKMHGIGNDYIYVNCFKETVTDPEALSIQMSDRHFGVGSDVLILIKPSDKADFCMEIYNADGSRAKMCGNVIRCVAKYVYDYGLTDKTQITIDTDSGIKTLDLTVENGKVSLVRVDMGAPRFEAELVPVIADSATVINQRKRIGDSEYDITCLSTGSAHCVVPVEDPDALDLRSVAPPIRYDARFAPVGTNVNFVRWDGQRLWIRTYEKGVEDETLACGTGIVASALAASVRFALPLAEIPVRAKGGDLRVAFRPDGGGFRDVFLTGPAEFVGTVDVNL
jgi:diaminopimelate epimerase